MITFDNLIVIVRIRLAQWSNQLSNVGDDAFISEFHRVG